MSRLPGLHVTGQDAATGAAVDLWLSGGIFVPGPIADAVELRGWTLPGFVDAHCHIGYSEAGAVTLEQAEEQARTNLTAGVLAIRDCGSPIDTRPLTDRDDLPILVRAGRHIARPKRYIRDLGVDLDDPADLPAEVRRQIAYGGGWIKLVGDWIDRDTGELAPLWPDAVLREAIELAHDAGCRVTAHVFGENALPGLLAGGIDCIEHGTGLTDETIGIMADRGVHLVPTMINIANFPMFADAATRFPAYAGHMRELYRRSDSTFGAAAEAGVSLHAGTDAGGYIQHGRIVDEIVELSRILPARRALDAATHAARQWLGLGAQDLGDSADLMVFADDPALDLQMLRRPVAIIRAGTIRAGSRLDDAGAA